MIARENLALQDLIDHSAWPDVLRIIEAEVRRRRAAFHAVPAYKGDEFTHAAIEHRLATNLMRAIVLEVYRKADTPREAIPPTLAAVLEIP